ncbi:ketoacyl-ACP synthase III [bacterium]|nr:ketoacyl-ACP synthase III [bacterium]
MKDVVIRSSGRYLPEKVITNDHFATILDTSDEWIRDRTGIRERRFAAPDERNSDMGTKAAQQCLERAGVDASEVDLIICATVTGDRIFPATANFIQENLGNRTAWSFDVNAACGGFIYALSLAYGMLASGVNKRALVIGSEKMTSILDFTDRATCVLFGDGAGALLLEAVDPADNPQGFGLREFVLGSDGSLAYKLWQPDGGSVNPPNPDSLARHGHYIHMSGREVYTNAVRTMNAIVEEVIAKAGLTPDQIDWFVPHQANKRIIDSVRERLKMPEERFVVNIDRYGNTTSGTIPIGIDELYTDNKLAVGQKVVLMTFGAGFTWGATYLVWGDPLAGNG